jgi:hypothetical protein
VLPVRGATPWLPAMAMAMAIIVPNIVPNTRVEATHLEATVGKSDHCGACWTAQYGNWLARIAHEERQRFLGQPGLATQREVASQGLVRPMLGRASCAGR